MLNEILFSGMKSLEDDSLVKINQATIAENCYVDKNILEPRNGYRALTAAALAGSGNSQGLFRFRPNPTSARSVAAVGGTIYTVTDPASETTLGTASTVASPFGSSALISAAQLGRYLYLATDENGVSWQRMDSSFALSGLGALPKGTVPTYSLSSLSVLKFTTLAAPTLSACSYSTVATDYHQVTPSSTTNSIIYNFGSDQNWISTNWLAVIVSPATQSDGDGTVTITIATSSGNFEKIGEINDGAGAGSPCIIFCNLNTLSSATRSAARRIQFASNTTSTYLVHGIIAIPSAPQSGSQKYRVTFKNSTTAQRSIPTEEVEIVYKSDQISIPQFHCVRRHRSSYSDEGLLAADPDAIPFNILHNKSVVLAMPSRYEFGSVPTFTITIPTANQYPSADTAELWRLTETGWRLVKNKTYGAAVTSVQIADDLGIDTLTHELYKSQGTPPRVTCLAARSQRLIGAYENRVYVSSFTPTSASSDPYVQFPDIPINEADGWSFDISPSNIEQIQSVIDGDGLYIVSNANIYVMSDLAPNSIPYKVFNRGALGRQSCEFAESMFFVASWDGVYSVENRASVNEITQPIRRMYRDWLAPDSTVQVKYQNRKLFIFCNQKYLRYDFVTQRWTRGTISHNSLFGLSFRDYNQSVQNFWFLTADRKIMRWQPKEIFGTSEATTDDGTTIPAWIYQSGYDFEPVKSRVRSFLVETKGTNTITFTTSDDDAGRVKVLRDGIHQYPHSADQSGYRFRFKIVGINRSTVKRLLLEKELVEAEGA